MPFLNLTFFFLAERMEDQKGDVKSDEVVGYVHNVSPVKSGHRFDFQLQTQEKNVRGECFRAHLATTNDFKK